MKWRHRFDGEFVRPPLRDLKATAVEEVGEILMALSGDQRTSLSFSAQVSRSGPLAPEFAGSFFNQLEVESMDTESSRYVPVPQGKYVPAKRHGELIFTSGMTPRNAGMLTSTGPVRKDTPPEDYREAVTLACANALAAARSTLAEHERIASICSLTVYIAAEQGFTGHSRLADFASEYLLNEVGENGVGCRAAVGVATLPDNATVEIQLIATT